MFPDPINDNHKYFLDFINKTTKYSDSFSIRQARNTINLLGGYANDLYFHRTKSNIIITYGSRKLYYINRKRSDNINLELKYFLALAISQKEILIGNN